MPSSQAAEIGPRCHEKHRQLSTMLGLGSPWEVGGLKAGDTHMAPDGQVTAHTSGGPASHLTPILSGPSSCHRVQIKPEKRWGELRNTEKNIRDHSISQGACQC